MPRSRRWTSDRGSAALEFVTAGVLLLIPLVYLVLVVAAVQSAALATEGAARQGARVVATASDEQSGERALALAIEVTLADYGIEAEDATVTVDCAPAPQDCLTRGGLVTVTVDARVALPLVPAALEVRDRSGLPVVASASQPVSRFRGTP